MYQTTPGGKQVWKATLSPKGVVLLGTSLNSQSSIYTYSNGTFTLLCDSLEDAFSFWFDKDGNVLISARKGTYLFHVKPDGSFKPKPQKQTALCFYDMVEDAQGVLWGSAFPDMQLYYRKGEDWVLQTGLPVESQYDYNGTLKVCLHRLLALPDNRIVAATQFGSYLIVGRDSNWKSYPVPIPHGQFDGIQQVRRAEDGSIWVATWHHGIYVLCSVQTARDRLKAPLYEDRYQAPTPPKAIQPPVKPTPPNTRPKVRVPRHPMWKD